MKLSFLLALLGPTLWFSQVIAQETKSNLDTQMVEKVLVASDEGSESQPKEFSAPAPTAHLPKQPRSTMNNALLNVFPAATYNAPEKQRGHSELSKNFTPSKSLWAEGLDESNVFLAEMVHTQNSKRDFSLRFGTGGQIYSLRGPFGESVPPSWRADGGNKSPWNDEVWQFVAVCKKYNGLAQTEQSLYRDWRANHPAYKTKWKDWQTRPANSFRNYDVCEVIPKLLIRPGQTIWYRSFLVVGPKKRVMQQATKLVDHVDYGLLDFDAKSSPKLRVSVDNNSVSIVGVASAMATEPATASKTKTKFNFLVYARPVAGTKPLFLIQNQNTGQKVVTTDPYFFVSKEKLDINLPEQHPLSKYYNKATGYSLADRNSKWESLLGFAREQKPASGNWSRLSKVLNESFFPGPNRFHLDLWVKTVD